MQRTQHRGAQWLKMVASSLLAASLATPLSGQTSDGKHQPTGVQAGQFVASSGATSPPKGRHGEKGASDGSDQWEDCDDDDSQSGNSNSRSVVVPLSALATVGSGSVSFKKATVPQSAGVLAAARKACLMQDTAQLDGNPAKQHDEKTFTVGGVAIALRFRPVSNIAAINLDTVPNDHGFIAGDFKNVTPGTTYTYNGHSIKDGHSALLWYGRDHNGYLYSAVFDLGGFPLAGKPSLPFDGWLMESGGIRRPEVVPHNYIAFARWADPHPIIGLLFHDGTWVDCNAGCCVASADISFAGRKNLHSKVRRSPR
jgi:hypothetical protein